MPQHRFSTLCIAAGAVALAGWAASRPGEIVFERQMIDPGASETVAIADVNGDGQPDIVSGEYWYEAPKWARHKFREIDFTNNYVDNFSDLPLDVNGDGRPDIVSCSWFSKKLYWSENPGKAAGQWKEHTIENRFPIEFAFLVDLNNDGKANEVLPEFGDAKAPLAWYESRGGEMVAHVVADHSFGHGIGAGDVNKDGRTDIIVPTGWFEAPPDPRSGAWTFHGDFNLGETGFIHVLDVNGDGRPDIVTSLAHNYGIFWMEHTPEGTWVKHIIDDSWSQAHSLVLADIDGDGQMDLVTGKRFMAHNGKDPGEREPLGIYWYQHFKTSKGAIEWVKHVIDYSSRTGGGMQVTVTKLDSRPGPDIVVGGKSGLFLFRRASPVAALPGNGLAQHDFFYAGEQKEHWMFLVRNGKVVWSYVDPASKGEISDAVLLSNGNVLFAHQFGVTMITPQKKVVWNYDAPPGTEIHTAQPIGKTRVVFVQNGDPALLRVVNIVTGKTEREFALPVGNPKSVHGQFRHARLTEAGTILVAHMDNKKVAEYDTAGKEVWSVDIPSPWSAERLKNGNTLITTNQKLVREVSPKGETVWEVNAGDLPDYRITGFQIATRLPNGNTLVGNWLGSWPKGDKSNVPVQALEVTPDKTVAWALRQVADPDLGPSTTIQLLDRPGAPENVHFGSLR